MDTRIERDFCLSLALHYEGKFHVNTYDITASMLIETDNTHEQRIAMARAMYVIEELFQDSILICVDEKTPIRRYKRAGLNICALPEQPYDQIFAMVLLMKLNAVMEGRLRITDLVLGSAMGEGVRYSIVAEVAEDVLQGTGNWWHRPSPTLTECEDILGSKVIRLFDNTGWIELGLSWRDMDHVLTH